MLIMLIIKLDRLICRMKTQIYTHTHVRQIRTQTWCEKQKKHKKNSPEKKLQANACVRVYLSYTSTNIFLLGNQSISVIGKVCMCMLFWTKKSRCLACQPFAARRLYQKVHFTIVMVDNWIDSDENMKWMNEIIVEKTSELIKLFTIFA